MSVSQSVHLTKGGRAPTNTVGIPQVGQITPS